MNDQRRQERNVFLLFLGASLVAVMAALPIVVAQTTPQPEIKRTEERSAAGASQKDQLSDQPSFEHVDRNKDGFVDKSEAGVVPGMSANFERADRNRDGRLDEGEFAKALEILSVRR
jgi:Ca2+-binding EF-hand superfamily protein